MRWPEIRAGLIALAIFFGLVDGCPTPAREITPDWLKPSIESVRRAQKVVLTPVAWVRWRLQITQRWSLYQAPRVERYRLWVEGQDRSWRILYRASDAEHTDDATLLDSPRVRGAYDPTDIIPVQAVLFARWYTRRVLDRHPELAAARVRLEKVRLTKHGFESTGKFVELHLRLRGQP